VRVCVLLALICPVGCGENGGQQTGKGADPIDLLPALDEGVRLVLEAETGKAEPAMAVAGFEPYRHEVKGMQRASGGKCVVVPKDANRECKATPENPKGKPPVGKLTLDFTVPEDGTYYIYPRTWWRESCWNSFHLSVDGAKPLVVTDTTYKVWHWVMLMADGGNNTPRPFRLKKGKHELVFMNREDDVKLDQVYITDDPDDRPAGIMKVDK